MLDEKRIKLITFLSNQSDWTTASDIANALNISVRSVKYCVSTISEEYPNLISSSNKGYQIDRIQCNSILIETKKDNVPSNYAERKKYIICCLLLHKEHPTMNELADLFCISYVTLQNELSRIKTEISEYHLNIHIKKDVLSISGTEKDKRAILMSMINDEIQDTYYSLEKIQEVFSDINLKDVRDIVTSVFKQYEYFLDNYSLLNYVLHLALSITLKSETNDSVDKENIVNLSKYANAHIIQIVDEIYKKLKEKYNRNFSLYDIYEASLLMMTHAVSSNIDKLHISQIEGAVGSEAYELLLKISESVNSNYCISLSNESFLVRFAFHIKNLLLRLRNNISIKNLQFDTIKNGYPMLYAISVHISQIITDECGFILPEDEIAYITLHLGMMVEEDKAVRERVKALLVCSDYHTMGTNVFKKLNTIYSENLLITNVVTSVDKSSDLKNIELIITTVPIDGSIGVRQYVIDPFISEKNIRELFICIDDIKTSRMKNLIREKILYFFQKDLFITDKPFNTDVETIEYMCGLMFNNGYVSSEYKQKIYAHEAIAPSSYGNVAIPHPLGNDAKSSVIALSINPVPISWGINKVNLVFMLSLKEEDRDMFSEIFNFITKILNDEIIYKKIMNCHTFDEFVNLLVSFY